MNPPSIPGKKPFRMPQTLGRWILALFLAALPASPGVAQNPDIVSMLRRADESRGNLTGIQWQVTVETAERTRTSRMTYQVKARGFDILGVNTAPPKSAGNKILMLSGNMWFYKPGLSKPVPISRRQKLMGNASYGDIAATNYAEDYLAALEGEDLLEGEPCWVLSLKTDDAKATYDTIRYWISKTRQVGVKAVYYTVSGKAFKSARMVYAHSVRIGGETRPFISEIQIFDELMTEDVTRLRLEDPRVHPMPDYIFNLNFLKQ
jgi:hypothetical protein